MASQFWNILWKKRSLFVKLSKKGILELSMHCCHHYYEFSERVDRVKALGEESAKTSLKRILGSKRILLLPEFCSLRVART